MTYEFLGVAALGQAYRAGRLSPAELVEDLLARIDRLEPDLNCFITLDREAVRADAAAATDSLAAGGPIGPLHGVPIGIKDVIDVEGQPTTCHSRTRLNHIAAGDAASVASLRRAGAIIMGKLSTHEYAIGGPAFDLPFPPARNPWNPAHHPGGSSSGSGAAVAAGMLPGALGTDTGGSVRNPASQSGIVGLKPTYDLIPRAGVFPLSWSLDCVGVLTRHVADAALMLEGMTGNPATADLTSGVDGVRIGVVRHFHEIDMQATPEVAAAFEAVAEALSRAGAVLVPVTLPPLSDFDAVNRVVLKAEGFAIHGEGLRQRPEDYSSLLRRGLLPGAFLSAETYLAAQRRRVMQRAAVDAALAEVDVLMTASSMEPACRIDDPAEIDRSYMLQARIVFSNTGHPALAMMSGLSASGLPLSIQFAARHHDERTLLRVAAAWERLAGFPVHPPG